MGDGEVSDTFKKIIRQLTGMTKIGNIVIPSLTWLYYAAGYSRH